IILFFIYMDEQELCRTLPDTTGGLVKVPPPTFCERVAECIGDFLGDFNISDGTNTDTVNLGETITFFGLRGLTVTIGANSVTYGLPIGTSNGQVLQWDGSAWVPGISPD